MVNNGAQLWTKGIQKQLTANERITFQSDEELLYHYNPESASLTSLLSDDQTTNCLLLTNRRLIRIAPKADGAATTDTTTDAPRRLAKSSGADSKQRSKAGGAADAKNAGLTIVDIARADIIKVVHMRGGTFSDDTLTVTLWDRNQITIKVFHEKACAFFARILDDSIRAKQHAPPDFTKFNIPASVRFGKALEQYRILKNVATNKLLNVCWRMFSTPCTALRVPTVCSDPHALCCCESVG